MIPRLQIAFSAAIRKAYWHGEPYKPQENEFLLNHSRSGLWLALCSLRLPKRSRVGVMAYNCHTVMNAVYQAEMTPIFIDITRDLKLDMEDLERKIEEMQVLIVTHLFGILNDVTEIRKRYPQLIIIDDCAHACGIPSIEGDFATFSIGQAKLPSIGDGGVLVVQNPKYLEAVRANYPKAVAKRSWKRFLKLWVMAILYKPFIYTIFTKPVLKRDKVHNPIESMAIAPMDKGIAAIYKQMKPQIPMMIAERKRNAEKINKIVPVLVGCNAFMAVCVCDEPKKVAALFPKVETATHFAHCIDWARYFGYHDGDCPNAEYLTSHVLVIPTYKIR